MDWVQPSQFIIYRLVTMCYFDFNSLWDIGQNDWNFRVFIPHLPSPLKLYLNGLR